MTIQLDAVTAGGVVLIIGAIGGWAVKIIAEIRNIGRGQAATDTKLEDIKATTEQSAKNVDGNLSAVRAELARQTAENRALHQTVTTLSAALSASKTAGAITASRRATDAVEAGTGAVEAAMPIADAPTPNGT